MAAAKHWNLFRRPPSGADDRVRSRDPPSACPWPGAQGRPALGDGVWRLRASPAGLMAPFVCLYNAMYWDLDAGRRIAKPSLQKDRAHHRFARLAYATSAGRPPLVKPNLGLMRLPAGVDWQRNAPYPSPVAARGPNNLGVPFVWWRIWAFTATSATPAKRWALRLAPQQSEAADIASTAGWSPVAILPPSCRISSMTLAGATSSWMRMSTFDPSAQPPSASGRDPRGVGEQSSKESGRTGSPPARSGALAPRTCVHWSSQAVAFNHRRRHRDPHTGRIRYDEAMGLTPFCRRGRRFFGC